MTENVPIYPDLPGKVAGGSGGIGAVVDEIRSDGGQGLPGLRERSSFAYHTGGRLHSEAASALSLMEPNDARNLFFAASVIGSANQTTLRPDGRFHWLGQGKEAEEACHRLPVAFDLHLPGTQRPGEGVALVDQRGQRGRVGLDDRIRVVRAAALDLEAPPSTTARKRSSSSLSS